MLVDRNPSLVKRTLRRLKGRDPRVAHVGIASNLRNRVTPSHEKFDPNKQTVVFKEVQRPKNRETWKSMGHDESIELGRIKPYDSHLGRGGAGRTPKWAKRTEDP